MEKGNWEWGEEGGFPTDVQGEKSPNIWVKIGRGSAE